MPKVIVVGSAPSVLDEKLGDKIDKFDVVIRFNAYEIEGFEEHVGTKQTIWCPNLGLAKHPQTVKRYMRRSNTYVWYVGNNAKMELLFVKVKQALKKQFTVESLNFGYVDYLRKLAPSFKEEKLGYKGNKIRVGPKQRYATTGLRGIFKALQRYDKVTIHGFTSYAECEGKAHSSHYYEIDNVPRHMHRAFKRHPNAEHDVETEKLVIDKLVDMKLVKRLS